jgi:hypothetical protein
MNAFFHETMLSSLDYTPLLLISMKTLFQQFIKFHVAVKRSLFESADKFGRHAKLQRHKLGGGDFASLAHGGLRRGYIWS